MSSSRSYDETRDERFCLSGRIVCFLEEAEGDLPGKNLCSNCSFAEASSYLWRSRFGGMESARWKKLLAESMLENDVTRDGRDNNFNLNRCGE